MKEEGLHEPVRQNEEWKRRGYVRKKKTAKKK
jgi:hypothetical protein